MAEEINDKTDDSKLKDLLETQKLKLEIKKLEQPFFLRPEFLGLIIPFLTIFATYIFNKKEIDQALKQRKWEIDKANWELDIKNEKLKEDIKLNSYRNDSLKNIYNLALEKKTNEIASLEKKAGEIIFKLNSKETELQLWPIKEAIRNIKSKETRQISQAYLDLLNPMDKSKIQNTKILQDSILAQKDFNSIVKLRSYLILGSRNKIEIKKLKDYIFSNNKEIDGTILNFIENCTSYIGYNFPLQSDLQTFRISLLEFIVSSKRLGNQSLEPTDYNILLPDYFWEDSNKDPIVLNDIIVLPYFVRYFKDIENYFELIQINLKMINSPRSYGEDRQHGIARLAQLNPLIFLSKTYELIKANVLTKNESSLLLKYLPDKKNNTILGPREGYEKYNVPSSLDIENWEKWKHQNLDVFNKNNESNLEKLFAEIRTNI